MIIKRIEICKKFDRYIYIYCVKMKSSTIDLNDAERLTAILSESNLTDVAEQNFVKALRFRTSKQVNG